MADLLDPRPWPECLESQVLGLLQPAPAASLTCASVATRRYRLEAIDQWLREQERTPR